MNPTPRPSRAELVGALASSAHEIGACLVCREAPPETDVCIHVRRLRNAELVGSTQVHTYDVLPVWIPTCAGCRVQPRFVVARMPSWAVLALLFGGLLSPTALGLTGVLQQVPRPWDIVAFVAPTALVLGFFGLDWLIVSLRLGRLWRAHPMSSALAARGFAPSPSRGTSKLDLYVSQLRDPFSELRARAELELIAAGGSEVVAATTALLGHRHATEPALRILVALRATDAIPAIQALAAGGNRAHAAAAREALVALGCAPEVPAATLPAARVIER